MTRSFSVKGAAELMDEAFTAKWRDRQALDPLPRRVLGVILDELVATGEPVEVDAVARRLRQHGAADVRRAVAQLDEKDLIATGDGRVMVAYPFAATPTAFTVRFPDGRERYAVCAIDALGVPAMLRHPVTIRSHCHHCREPLELDVRRDGPAGARDVMVWVGERGQLHDKAFSSL